MPPKCKPIISSPPSILVSSPATPSTAQLVEQHEKLLAEGNVTMMMDSSPLLPKSKQREAKILNEEEVAEETEVLPSEPDAAGDGSNKRTSAKQGTAALETTQKKTTAHEREAAPTDDAAEPAAEKKTAPKEATASRKNATASKRRSKKDLDNSEEDQPLHPLPLAFHRKVAAVNAFLDTRPEGLLVGEAEINAASVDELDLLAALIILRVDYQLAYTVADVSFEDADEMIISRIGTERVGVDFDKTCDIKRTVQAKLSGRQMGLEKVNLLEVEIVMLIAKRKQLLEDEMSAAGFRQWDH